MTKEFGFQYSGKLYRSVGDFLGENYHQYGFTKGSVQDAKLMQFEPAFDAAICSISNQVMMVARKP